MLNLRLITMAAFACATAALLPDGVFAQATASPAPSSAPAPKNAPTAIPAPSPSPSPSPTPVPKVLQLSAYLDAGLTSVGLTDAVRFVSGAPSRIFDGGNGPFFDSNGGKLLGQANDFNNAPNLQNINLQLAINPAGQFGGKLETSLGSDADFLASNGQMRSKFNLTQAYAQYAGGPLTIIAGKFYGLAGYELANTTSNTNFSRDYLYGAVMSTETGVRATYALNSKVSLIAGVNNGWDDWKFAGKKKTLEASLALTPSPGYSFALTTYNGNDFLANGNSALGLLPVFTNRTLYDGILTVHATSALTLVANYDSGNQLGDIAATTTASSLQSSQRWAGIAGYVDYQFTPQYQLSLRKETYRDAQGFRTGAGVPLRLQTSTATINYTPTSNYIVRAEYRLDASDGNNFTYRHLSNLPTDIPGRPTQSSVSFEFVYKLP